MRPRRGLRGSVATNIELTSLSPRSSILIKAPHLKACGVDTLEGSVAVMSSYLSSVCVPPRKRAKRAPKKRELPNERAGGRAGGRSGIARQQPT